MLTYQRLNLAALAILGPPPFPYFTSSPTGVASARWSGL
jgi:hypothetical protein